MPDPDASLPVLFDSLLAVFLLIALGYGLSRFEFMSADAWKGVERVTYFVLFPTLVMKTLLGMDLSDVPVIEVGLALLGANLLMAGVLLGGKWLMGDRLAAPPFQMDGPAFTSVFQGVMRWNTFVAIALANNLYGAVGVTLTSIAIALLIPLLNLQSVLVLRRYGGGTGGSLLRGLATNPFILATAIGLTLNAAGVVPPKSIGMTLDILGRCALGMGLLLVGAGLRPHDIIKPNGALIAGVVLRLIGMPLVGIGIALALGLGGAPLAVVAICLGVPSASASYILARQMGGDATLMAAILTAQTLCAALTLPMLLIMVSG